MPVNTQRVTVKVKENPNNKVTAQTKQNLGVNAVKGDDSIGVRIIGIPGRDGESNLTWNGVYSSTTEYSIGNIVSYLGSTYIYINNESSSNNNPVDTLYWDIFTVGNANEVYSNMKKLIDDDSPFLYIGYAAPGTLETTNDWSIKRIEFLESGDINVLWANGNNEFINNWANRLTYTYN